MINIKMTDKNGPVSAIRTVNEQDEVICMTKNGKTIRMYVKDISVVGRNTQGVRLVRLEEEDKALTIARIVNEEELSGHRVEFKPSEEEDGNGENETNEQEETSQMTEGSEERVQPQPEQQQETTQEKEKQKDFTLEGYEEGNNEEHK